MPAKRACRLASAGTSQAPGGLQEDIARTSGVAIGLAAPLSRKCRASDGVADQLGRTATPLDSLHSPRQSVRQRSKSAQHASSDALQPQSPAFASAGRSDNEAPDDAHLHDAMDCVDPGEALLQKGQATACDVQHEPEGEMPIQGREGHAASGNDQEVCHLLHESSRPDSGSQSHAALAAGDVAAPAQQHNVNGPGSTRPAQPGSKPASLDRQHRKGRGKRKARLSSSVEDLHPEDATAADENVHADSDGPVIQDGPSGSKRRKQSKARQPMTAKQAPSASVSDTHGPSQHRTHGRQAPERRCMRCKKVPTKLDLLTVMQFPPAPTGGQQACRLAIPWPSSLHTSF